MAGEFLSLVDLEQRWIYTPRGTRKLTGNPSFPPPAFTVSGGRFRVWSLAAIEAFEATHPEVRSEQAKRHKLIGYRRARAKGRPDNHQQDGHHGA